MNKLDMESKNIVNENIQKISELFPNVIVESNDGKTIDFDLLKQELSKDIVEGVKEKYQLTWPGKKEAIVNANTATKSTLRPVKEKSVDFDNTQNIYIEGDNLEVLKILQESYLNKIKCIFIDPPYNTGSDFIYDDNFSKDLNMELVDSGQMDEDGIKLVSNTDSNGRFHSDWLSMIYSRLKLAKNLLTDDGAIFISIDYNEVANLKKIMDEIFGEKNFQREIIWRIGWLSGYKTIAPNFIRNHDTILFYSKNTDKLDFHKHYIENKDFKPLIKKDTNLISKLKELGLDNKKQNELLKFINHDSRPDRYPIEDTWNSNEYDDLNSISIVSFSGEKVSKMLNIDEDFKGQKSLKMLSRIIQSITNDNDIILDFFSGTSSTAHAVMLENVNYNKKLKYIMVQIPADIDCNFDSEKTIYSNICDMAQARIKKAGAKIKQETNADIDYGFRVYKTDTTNMKDVYYMPNDLEQGNLAEFESNIKEDRTTDDLLTQVILDLGLSLDLKIEEKMIGKNKVYYVAGNSLVACFDDSIDIDIVDEICECEPYKVVFKDSAFKTDNDKINLEERFKKLLPQRANDSGFINIL